MTDNAPHLIARSVRSAANWIADVVYVVDLVVVGGLVGIVLLAGANPLQSTAVTVALATTAVVMILHHRWFLRHRPEVLHDRAAHAARERRGF
jgi:hypothetical protein